MLSLEISTSDLCLGGPRHRERERRRPPRRLPEDPDPTVFGLPSALTGGICPPGTLPRLPEPDLAALGRVMPLVAGMVPPDLVGQ